MKSSWRDRSQEIFVSLLLEYEAQQLLLDEPFDKEKAVKITRKKYPYQAKVGHAWKSWNAAVRWTKNRLNEGLSVSEISRLNWKDFDRQRRHQTQTQNQLTLFGELWKS